ncbi:hypothetical protein [Mesorhizobium sp.]|uniref:hypothetical protein n=1 Tax=Mesorhizobium sp. TaxID=1871066 RepID=UPI000FE5F0FA|nr:hypothetical protein [Mesorhizobium sp.]RWO81008.1 MAG: hypothetical protein EOQ95_28690 [Mesorhizobium sp.]RWQ53885.1 MAG: hypothetical protein EOS84_13925 [Mesorhizobium sp.]
MQELSEFRERLQPLMGADTSRPFVCDGNPLDCRFFVVGFNPATTVGRDFWQYWSNEAGFDKYEFMRDYLRVKKLRGARPRIEAIVEQFPSNWCLETNICSVPTKQASDLASRDRRTAIFEFLFEAIRPELVFVHSNEPIEFFRRATGCEDFRLAPQSAEWCGHKFTLFGKPGPIWRMAVDDARAVGRGMARLVWDGPEGGAARIEEARNPIARLFAERFSQWSIKLPWPDLEQRRAGKIVFKSWWIQYRFGEDDRGEFLDYLAEHRMSGSEHVRIHADGERKTLPALSQMQPVCDDPIENERLQAKYEAGQHEIAMMLREKGFI